MREREREMDGKRKMGGGQKQSGHETQDWKPHPPVAKSMMSSYRSESREYIFSDNINS